MAVSKAAYDGGYYAIKGFLYQFDRTMLELLQGADPVYVEHIQDINTPDTVVQCKHKEAKDYAPSSIRGPIIQLIEVHRRFPELNLRLYCHFRDRAPSQWRPTSFELSGILGKSEGTLPPGLRDNFLSRLMVEFAPPYEEQFARVIDQLQRQYNCDFDQALTYHALVSSNLLKVAIRDTPESRKITAAQFKDWVNSASRHLFFRAYREVLGEERLIKHLKKTVFRPSTNISNFVRLLVCQLDNTDNIQEAAAMVCAMSRRYYRRVGAAIKSQPPYVCLVGDSSKEAKVKKRLYDTGVRFRDGYPYLGSDFHMSHLTETATAHNEIALRFVPPEMLASFIGQADVHEVYAFGIRDRAVLETILACHGNAKVCLIDTAEKSVIRRMIDK